MLSFAIVIPSLNQSHFLPSALESLKCQTASFELAVMDGGSLDGFDGVVDEYADMITYLSSAPDGGQASAIRKGKDLISGDIVAWLNADDYYFPKTLDIVANFFELNPNVDVVYGDAIHITPDGFFLSYFPSIQEFSTNDLTRNCFICQPACFVRRTAYEKVGGIDPTLHYTMDWDLWCRLSNSGAKFCYLHEVLAAVRYYHGTKTMSGDWKRYMEIWRIERQYGRRLLPQSWPGFYFFDVLFRKKKSTIDKCAFALWKNLKTLKKKFINKNELVPKNNYGFHQWDTIAEGLCTIHIPCYKKYKCSKLGLKVKPETSNYRVFLNGIKCEEIKIENGILAVKLPELENHHREISIECMESKKWQLLEFICDLE